MAKATRADEYMVALRAERVEKMPPMRSRIAP